MTIPEIIADLTVTRRPPTDAECHFIAKEGTATQVSEALCFSCGTSKPLLKRHNKDRRTRP